MGDLRDEVWRLRRLINEDGGDDGSDSAIEQVQQLQKVNGFLQNELMKKESEIQAKDKEIEDLKAKLEKKGSTNCFVWVFLFVLAMVVAMVCNVKMA